MLGAACSRCHLRASDPAASWCTGATEVRSQAAEIPARILVVWLQCNRLLEMPERAGVVAATPQGRSEVVVCLGVEGIGFERRSVVLGRFLEPTSTVQGDTQT